MANAVVGNLRVNLGLDSAEFAAGLSAAGGNLDSFNRTADGFGKKVQEGADKGGGAMGRFGQSLRGPAMQLSQMAQQASAMGGGLDDWLKAFFVQLPDLALALGPVGIAVGAVAGALGTYAVNAFLSADGGKKLEDAVDALSDAFTGYKSAVQEALSPMGDLEKRFGSMAERMAPILRGAAANARLGMVDEIRAGLTEATRLLDENSDVLAGLQPRTFAAEFDLVGVFSKTTEEAARMGAALRDAMVELRNAPDVTAQVDAAIRLRDAYQTIADASGSRSAEEQEYLASLDAIIIKLGEIRAQDELLAAATETRAAVATETATTLEEAASAASEAVAGATLDPAEIERARVAVEGIREHWEGVKDIMSADMSGITGPFIAAMDLMKQSAADAEAAIPASIGNALNQLAGLSDGARVQGDAIGRAIVDGAVAGVDARAPALNDRVRALAASASATFRSELDIRSPSRVFRGYGVNIADGLAQGIGAGGPRAELAAQEMAAMVRDAGDLGGFSATMKNLGRDVLDAARAVGQGTKSIGDAFRDLVMSRLDRQLGTMMDNALSALAGAFGFTGSGGVAGNDVLSQALRAIPGFANGTRDFAGGLAMVGERGRELVSLPPHSRVYSNAATERMLRPAGRAESVHVTVGVDPRNGSIAPYVDRRVDRRVTQSDQQFPSRWAAVQREKSQRYD